MEKPNPENPFRAPQEQQQPSAAISIDAPPAPTAQMPRVLAQDLNASSSQQPSLIGGRYLAPATKANNMYLISEADSGMEKSSKLPQPLRVMKSTVQDGNPLTRTEIERTRELWDKLRGHAKQLVRQSQ